MATLKLILYKYSTLKNGGYKIKVAVCHKQQTSYISTRFSLDSERQWSNGCVVRRPDASVINAKLRALLDTYQDSLDSIQNVGLYSCSMLKNLIIQNVGGSDKKTFNDVATEYIDCLKKESRISYASLLELSAKYFVDSFGTDFLMRDISTTTIESFKSWLKANTDANENTRTKYLAHIKVFVNYAAKMKYVSYESHPFSKTKLQRSKSRIEDVSLDTIIAIRDAELKLKNQIVARDLFMLSFYLGGMNLIDLMSADFSDISKIEYVRSKTRNRGGEIVRIPIVPEAQEIICRWRNKRTNKLDFGYSFTYLNFLRYVDRGISSIKKLLDIKETLIFYSARNTFSQFAADLGIPNQVIDYCLGHSSASKGVISYYVKVKYKQAEIAISRVVDYINHPDKYEEFLKLRQDIMLAKL